MIRRLLQVVEVISKAQSQKLPQASETQNKFSFASQIFSYRSSLEENLVDKILPSLRWFLVNLNGYYEVPHVLLNNLQCCLDTRLFFAYESSLNKPIACYKSLW